MLAQSQGRNEQVVNSYNLFIDSAKDVGGAAGKGDSFSLQLGADSIQAQDGQFLRLTLQEFSMYTNFYMVISTIVAFDLLMMRPQRSCY